MILINKKPVTLAEAKVLAGDLGERKELEEYFKTFSKSDKAKSDKIVEAMKALDNVKIKEDDCVKVADFLPQNSEEVNKIFNSVGLTEEEINSIISIVKNN